MRVCFAAFSVLVALGCGETDRNPILGGGGGGGGAGGTSENDAGPDAGEGASGRLSGSVCALSDLRRPTLCAAKPQGLAVSSGAGDTVTDSTGAFSLLIDDSDTVMDVFVEDPGGVFRTSIVRVTLDPDGPNTGFTLPVVADDVMLGVEIALGEGPSESSGILVAHLTDNGTPLAGALVSDTPPGTIGGTYYDVVVSPFINIAASTGAYGTAVVFGLPVVGGEVLFKVKASAASAPVDLRASVQAGAISFVTAEL